MMKTHHILLKGCRVPPPPPQERASTRRMDKLVFLASKYHTSIAHISHHRRTFSSKTYSEIINTNPNIFLRKILDTPFQVLNAPSYVTNTPSQCRRHQVCQLKQQVRQPKQQARQLQGRHKKKGGILWEFFPNVRPPPPPFWEPVFSKRKEKVLLHFRPLGAFLVNFTFGNR